MRKNYTAPYLFCDEYVADTMIASCTTGDCSNQTDGGNNPSFGYCTKPGVDSSVMDGSGNYCQGW